jgi:hypothetical protein
LGVTTENKSKQVSWRIPESLRHRLLSHAEYLSVEEVTTTEAMVGKWLEERLEIEEKFRALRTLGIAEPGDLQWQKVRADKGQFDEVLRRMLDTAPKKTSEIKVERKDTGKPPKPSRKLGR